MKRIIGIGFLAVLTAAGCGKKDDDESKTKAKVKAKATAGNNAGPTKTAAATQNKELPPPPKDSFTGKARLVNLYVAPEDGAAKKVDVWAARSFKHGPVRLAEGIELGKASDWFGAPKGMSVKVVEAGAGPDGEKLGGMFNPQKGEHVTGFLVARGNKASIGMYWETKTANSIRKVEPPPPEGKGTLILRAGQLRASDYAEVKKQYGDAFYVGSGKGECLPRRGKGSTVLGGTASMVHDLEPGKHKVTLHKWPDNKQCDTDPVYELEVDVEAGKGTYAIIYTPDGKKLAHMVIDRTFPESADATGGGDKAADK